jgi:hypothetical protein
LVDVVLALEWIDVIKKKVEGSLVENMLDRDESCRLASLESKLPRPLLNHFQLLTSLA